MGTDTPDPTFTVGDAIIIRTPIYFYLGRVARITPDAVTLEDASWVAETSYWTETLARGELREVEIYPHGCVVMRQAIVDFSPWRHTLPRSPIPSRQEVPR